MNPKTKEEIISKIIELELEITLAILNGHKPLVDGAGEAPTN